MTTADHVAVLLHALAVRARKDRGKGLTSAVGVVGDLGRIVAGGEPGDIRTLQAAVAGLREQLDSDDVLNQPNKALAGRNSHDYLAGAMWAINELMNAQLDVVERRPDADANSTRKFQVEQVVLKALQGGDPISPRDISSRADSIELGIRADEVSRALSRLLANDVIEQVPPDWPGGDRRRRYFRLAQPSNA